MDVGYQLTTGGVIERSKTTCRLPASCSDPQAVAILKNMVLIATKNNKLLVFELNRRADCFDECKLLAEIDVENDQQAPILNHSATKLDTDSSYSRAKNERAAKNSYLTRNASRQIEVDLNTS